MTDLAVLDVVWAGRYVEVKENNASLWYSPSNFIRLSLSYKVKYCLMN